MLNQQHAAGSVEFIGDITGRLEKHWAAGCRGRMEGVGVSIVVLIAHKTSPNHLPEPKDKRSTFQFFRVPVGSRSGPPGAPLRRNVGLG
jgi:hypothetical protein